MLLERCREELAVGAQAGTGAGLQAGTRAADSQPSAESRAAGEQVNRSEGGSNDPVPVPDGDGNNAPASSGEASAAGGDPGREAGAQADQGLGNEARAAGSR